MALSVRRRGFAESIMTKATVFEIKRFAVHDGDGIRTTVFLKGCPLKCLWCHNPEGISARSELAFYAHKCIGCGECAKVCPSGAHRMTDGGHVFDRSRCTGCGACAKDCLGNALTFYGKEMTVEELMPILLEDREFYDGTGGGVTLSGGECLLQADFCAELLCACREAGLHTAVDTSGAVPRESFDKVIPYTDVFLYDLKAATSETHARCTGMGNERILENLRYLDEKGCAIEIRIPYVPHYNSGEREGLLAILAGVKNLVRVRVLAYHSFAGSKYEALGKENTLPEALPTSEEIEEFQKAADAIAAKMHNRT